MRERASAIGADLDVREGARGGVLVVLELPLAGHQELAEIVPDASLPGAEGELVAHAPPASEP